MSKNPNKLKRMGIGTGLIMLTIFGGSLIWKGITGDGMTTRMGDKIIPCWMYVFAGLVLLSLPLVYLLIRTETGRSWLGY